MGMNSILERIQAFVERSRFQVIAMGFLSLLESTILPIPLEAVLLPYFYKFPKKRWLTATSVTIGCLIGATLFYICGSWFMESFGQTLLAWFTSDNSSIDSIRGALKENGFILILATGISPVPFQIAMLLAGAVDYSFGLFLLAATLARGLRYFGLAWLVGRYGERAEALWRSHKLMACGIAMVVLLLLYFLGRLVQRTLLA